MRTQLTVPLFALVLIVASGCAANRLYSWGNYDESLYAHYKKAADQQEYVQRTQTIVEWNETHGRKMPPGLYAEYGYALLGVGRQADAVLYFEKERATWPESTVLMDKLIRNVNRAPLSARTSAVIDTGSGRERK